MLEQQRSTHPRDIDVHENKSKSEIIDQIPESDVGYRPREDRDHRWPRCELQEKCAEERVR